MNNQSVSPKLWGCKFLRRLMGGRRAAGKRAGARTPRGLRQAGSRVRARCAISTEPRVAAEGHRRLWVLGGYGHISLAVRPSTSGVLRDLLKIPQRQTWHSAGSLCASGCIYGMPHSHPHRESLQTSVCTICNNVCVWSRKCKRQSRRPHAQRQMRVHTLCVPGPSVPISEDRLKIIITKAS